MRTLSQATIGLAMRGFLPRIATHLRRNVPLALLDLCVVVPAYLGPLVVRFEGNVPDRYWKNFWAFVPAALVAHLLANYLFGLYGQMWRYASIEEARRLLVAGAAGGVVIFGIAFWMRVDLRPVPISVIILGAILSVLGFGAVRFQSRLFAFRRGLAKGEKQRVLLVGAGRAGAMILKDIRENPSLGLEPVAIVDDDPRKRGLSLHGLPILGTSADIPSLVARRRVDQVLLAAPSATSDLVVDIAELCEKAEVTLRVLPSVQEIMGGRITARDIRDLKVEDLLGRRQVETNLEAVSGIVRGRRVLVTGAGGSIGSEIVRQVAGFEPSALILLDHDETHLHDMRLDIEGLKGAEIALADVRDRERVLDLFLTRRPEVVFHAAAHKHVPLLELYPEEAVLTNVFGTANLVDAAVAAGVERFVLISTDKAVKPSSVMGATKWFGEQIVRSVGGRGSVFCAVRFGNVLGSRGSVIPTFLHQIAHGGPVTVTDPQMERYFMSLHEAVQLVLQAAALSHGGEVLTLEMGPPVKILDLARRLIRLSGRVPDRDVPITIVGRRPGEKLVEDLVDPADELLPSDHPGIMLARPQVPDLPALRNALWELETLVELGDPEKLADRVKVLAGASWQLLEPEGVR